MNAYIFYRKFNKLLSVTAILFFSALNSDISSADEYQNNYLYVGDQDSVFFDYPDSKNIDTVRIFDALNGEYVNDFFPPNANGDLIGPRGVIFNGDKLLLVDGQSGTPFYGQVLQFRKQTGELLPDLVDSNHPDALLWEVRGIIKGWGNTVYVADRNGRVAKFHISTGEFLGNFEDPGIPHFGPTGIVLGPDGKVYVAAVDNTFPPTPDSLLKGWILRFDNKTGEFLDVFVQYDASSSSCAKDLHRPEGLAFSPKGNLYVVSYRADAADVDRVLVFNKTGRCLDNKTIQLDSSLDDPRVRGVAPLFGPKGYLYLSVVQSGNPSTTPCPEGFCGEIQVYDVDKNELVTSFGQSHLTFPWYMTFKQTNRSTLAYE